MPTGLFRASGVAVCLIMASCAPKGARYTLHVTVAPDANDHTPVPTDLVFVWDKAEASKVAALSASAWFANKSLASPDKQKVTVCAWEWVPGQEVPDINLAIPPAARRWVRGVFLFADYRTGGPHGSRVTPGTAVKLELGRNDFKLTAVGKAASPAYTPLDHAPACQSTP